MTGLTDVTLRMYDQQNELFLMEKTFHAKLLFKAKYFFVWRAYLKNVFGTFVFILFYLRANSVDR